VSDDKVSELGFVNRMDAENRQLRVLLQTGLRAKQDLIDALQLSEPVGWSRIIAEVRQIKNIEQLADDFVRATEDQEQRGQRDVNDAYEALLQAFNDRNGD
jgi:hypothetical protein